MSLLFYLTKGTGSDKDWRIVVLELVILSSQTPAETQPSRHVSNHES